VIRRFAPLILLALLAAPAAADPVTAAGRYEVGERSAVIHTADGPVSVVGNLAQRLAPFAGQAVEVRGVLTPRGALAQARILVPERTEVTADIVDARTLLVDGVETAAVGNTAVLVPGRRALVDLWRFPAKGDEPARVHVVAVEAQTTQRWTLLWDRILGHTVVSGVVRGKQRRVWVVDRVGERVLVQRGGTSGWLHQSRLLVGEASAHDGLRGRLPD
jgi:hypothetical protein